MRAGALFVATNTDSTLPAARGTQPGNGSLVKVIENATGVAPLVAGKPEPPLHRESVIRTGAKRPLVIGDRLDTDIEAAFNAGADSLLVLTGVDNPRTATLAPEHRRPTYIAENLDALLQPYPEVTDGARAATCGDWTATAGRRRHADPERRRRADRRPARPRRRGLGLAARAAWTPTRPRARWTPGPAGLPI